MGFKNTIFDALNCLGTFKTFKTRQVFLNNLYINKICAFNVKLESYVLHTNTFFLIVSFIAYQINIIVFNPQTVYFFYIFFL